MLGTGVSWIINLSVEFYQRVHILTIHSNLFEKATIQILHEEMIPKPFFAARNPSFSPPYSQSNRTYVLFKLYLD